MIEHNPLYQAMKDAVSQTFENMAFTEVIEHFDQDYQIPEDQLAWTSLVVKDPVPGEIFMAVNKDALKELAGSMFLLDEDEITADKMSDILHELLNTVAGLFMTKLLAENQAFQIGLPVTGEGPLPEFDGDSVSWKLITGDEQPVQLFITGAPLVALND
ncbi:Chemotaxis phosphatase CheX [Malonomonas rubra DSM 5091]|uniref:Chemotaxis phosphatase CheX n=1 Tax=Malonomonas rubra DSM 5091 TaxID=1122189 RepID=A0A1M6GA20_MALRU|nr:chemotaxis protein CheX [Malonomonas rubra]SHJ06778.1 Chemotaxis phosphatase CheX [Malonomonas rubra DSM 5091]